MPERKQPAASVLSEVLESDNRSASHHARQEINYWRAWPIEGRSTADCTWLRDALTGAELTVTCGRLARGAGYEHADRESRWRLARVGAAIRLRARGRYVIHSAGAVDPRGRAWLLVGPSGCGKSTLAYALQRSGWVALGDDGVVLERADGAFWVHAWRQPMRISSELVEAFPELAPHLGAARAGDPRRRMEIAFSPARCARLHAVVLLSHEDHDQLAPALPAEILRALVEASSSLFLGGDESRAQLATLEAVARGAQGFRLAHGPAQLTAIASTLSRAGE